MGDVPASSGDHRGSNVNDRSASQGSDAFLVTASAPVGARRRALAVAIGLLAPFCALLPFARVPLPRIEAFIPISESILALTGLVTAASANFPHLQRTAEGVLHDVFRQREVVRSWRSAVPWKCARSSG